jgi:hypothetical protein
LKRCNKERKKEERGRKEGMCEKKSINKELNE